jgi:hypothetical protein
MNKNQLIKILLPLLKYAIVILAFYFIYNQLQNSNFIWTYFKNNLLEKFTLPVVLSLLLLSFINHFLEILKWKNLVSFILPITIYEATKQVLASLTAGTVTPNGIGEYAGKALYFDKAETKIIIFLNLVCNGIQMTFTIIFGILGLFLLGYYKLGCTISAIGAALFLFVYVTKNIKIKAYSINVLKNKLQEIPKKIHQKNIALGFLRYITFSHQYYFLFLLLGIDLPYSALIATVAIVYLLASFLPSFQLFDFAVKGSVALYFFGKYNINEWIIIFVSTMMWFLNIVIPVILGSFYVLNFKPKKNGNNI